MLLELEAIIIYDVCLWIAYFMSTSISYVTTILILNSIYQSVFRCYLNHLLNLKKNDYGQVSNIRHTWVSN